MTEEITTVATPPPAIQRCGLIAIVGRPNVGKSTLLNGLVGQKVSITSDKAQTTRHRITGVRTVEEAQFVFVDTPGFQKLAPIEPRFGSWTRPSGLRCGALARRDDAAGYCPQGGATPPACRSAAQSGA